MRGYKVSNVKDGKCEEDSKKEVSDDASKELSETERLRQEQLIKQHEKLKDKMGRIQHKIAIISGKGGVGKSTVTVNLAMAFAMRGHANSVGILDADIHGPCVPRMLGLHGKSLPSSSIGVMPVTGPMGIRVISMDILFPADQGPVIWRGPMKMAAIRQFLSDIVWGKLDFLFIDLPPGTGDEPLSIMQLLPEMDGVIIVTISSEVSQAVVKRAVNFARQFNMPIIGVIENMSGYTCPTCGTEIKIFKSGGGQKIAEELRVPFLGSIPIDPDVCSDSDEGIPYMFKHRDTLATKSFTEIVTKIERFLKEKEEQRPHPTKV